MHPPAPRCHRQQTRARKKNGKGVRALRGLWASCQQIITEFEAGLRGTRRYFPRTGFPSPPPPRLAEKGGGISPFDYYYMYFLSSFHHTSIKIVLDPFVYDTYASLRRVDEYDEACCVLGVAVCGMWYSMWYLVCGTRYAAHGIRCSIRYTWSGIQVYGMGDAGEKRGQNPRRQQLCRIFGYSRVYLGAHSHYNTRCPASLHVTERIPCTLAVPSPFL